MLIRFLRFLLGYVRFSVGGEFPERFLNQLAVGGVSVWGMRRRQDKLEAYVTVRDYLKFHRLKSKNRIVTKVLERYGLPFFVKRYRLRVGFGVGVAFFVAILFILSGFIWNIEVVGNKTLTQAEVLAALEELGLSEGVRRSALDQELLRTRLALKFDNIAWASVNIEGVKATVNISESKPPKKETLEPCNLVAELDGVITAIEVTEGTVKTAVGKTVKKGDLLVSGITEYKDGAYRFGVSSGKIFAETNRELTCFIPFEQTVTLRVGDPEARRCITFFGLNVPLYLGSVKEPYEVEAEHHRFEQNGMYLPITVTEAVFYKTETVKITLSEAEAKKMAEASLTELEKTELKNAEILEKSVDFEVTHTGVRIISKYNCRQNIAKTDLLLILEEK